MANTEQQLHDIAKKVRDEADCEAGFYGCQVVVVVVDEEGAFATCGSPSLNINTTTGVLARALHAFASSKERF